MPSKRTNDSVDRILEELSHEQAERGIRDSVTDRQVDAILQSLGHGSMEESSGGGSALGPIQKEDLPDITLGKGNNFNTEDRFSTLPLTETLIGSNSPVSVAYPKPNKPFFLGVCWRSCSDFISSGTTATLVPKKLVKSFFPSSRYLLSASGTLRPKKALMTLVRVVSPDVASAGLGSGCGAGFVSGCTCGAGCWGAVCAGAGRAGCGTGSERIG